MCFFRDEANGLPVADDANGTSLKHRKIIAYDMLWEQDSPNDVES